MRIKVSRPSSRELSFAFDTDEMDATIPIPAVWFRHDSVSQAGTLPVALMAYLMARPFIGNSFELVGHPLPAHLAARLHQDLGMHEFFVGPVTNVPERILPDFQYETMDVCIDEHQAGLPVGQAALLCRRNELGYSMESVRSAETPILSLSTNVDLFTAYTDEPRLLSFVLVYLCVFNILGIKRLQIRGVVDPRWLNRIGLLLAEVGCNACAAATKSLS